MTHPSKAVSPWFLDDRGYSARPEKITFAVGEDFEVGNRSPALRRLSCRGLGGGIDCLQIYDCYLSNFRPCAY